jgi:hypothetical protein
MHALKEGIYTNNVASVSKHYTMKMCGDYREKAKRKVEEREVIFALWSS